MSNLITSVLLISIFKNVIKDKVISSYINFLSMLNIDNSFEEIIKSYSEFISNLYDSDLNQNLYLHIKKLIYQDENIISKGCSDCINKNTQIIETAKYELSIIDNLLKYDYKKIVNIVLDMFPDKSEIILHLPVFNLNKIENFNIEDILSSYKKHGYGILSCYSAFKYTKEKQIIPVEYYDNITFSDLKNYDYQKQVIKQNTLAFLQNKDANNILLYGDRGCGKSSTVKALINEFSDYNLKMIQIYKESFIYLFDLYEKLRNLPLKFIIFADDISFNEDDKDFSSIKATLEGSLSNRPKNTLIYATTNRMHLVKESFTSREGNEVHYNDTIDEMVSLSDRFGIMLTFSILTKSEYLNIIEKIANDCCVEITDNLLKKAEEFAALKSIRTPRVARQFITDYIANS